MAEALLRSPASRQAGAFRTRKSSHEQRQQRYESSREQQLSRLVAGALGLTAQNNPNWRTRPISDSPQSSGKNSRETRRARGDHTSPGHSSGKGRSSNAQENRHSALQDTKPGGASSISRGTVGMLDSSQHGGLYHIYKHIDLGHFGFVNAPLSLIELGIPFDASPSPSLARVERLRKESRTRSRASENSKKERMKATLHEAHPHTMPLQGHCVSQSNPFSQTPPSSKHPDTASASNQNPADHDSAFQKMLQKLARSTGQTEKDHGPVEPEKQETSETSQVRHPIPFSGRRVNTLSEPCESWICAKPQTHQKEETADSGVCIEENVKSKTLNPKAREFLTKAELIALKNKEHSSERLASVDERPRPLPVQVPGPKDEQTSGPQRSGLIARGTSSSETTETGSSHHATGSESATKPVGDVPVKTLLPTAPPALAYGVSPFLLNHLFSGGGLLPLGSDQLSGQCLAPSPTLATLPTIAAQPVLQPIAGNILSFPPAPLMNTVFPSMAARPVDPYAMRPGCPVSAVGPMGARPSPVPKPRRPDPGDQQAYEAWIEWRKANEPGYAMECKLRQQRRAQRKLTDQSKAKSAKMTDTLCSA